MDMTADQTLQESCMGALRHMGVEVTALVDKTNRLEAENAKLQDENARLRSCLSDDAENARQIMAENAKLRSLARQWYPHMLKRVGRDALEQWGQMDVVKELGIEADE